MNSKVNILSKLSNSDLFIHQREIEELNNYSEERSSSARNTLYTRDMLKPVVVSQSELPGVLIAEGTEVSNNKK